MASFKIRANSLFVNRYLKVVENGVVFVETAAMGGKRKFRFDQIDYVLMSPTNVLSFQVGNEVFSLKTNPKRLRHQQAIQQLIGGAKAAQEHSAGFPVIGATSVL